MHIFVTGGAGFIGSAYVHALLQDDVAGTSVTVLDGLSCSGDRDNLAQTHPRLRPVRVDITDDRLVRELRHTPRRSASTKVWRPRWPGTATTGRGGSR